MSSFNEPVNVFYTDDDTYPNTLQIEIDQYSTRLDNFDTLLNGSNQVSGKDRRERVAKMLADLFKQRDKIERLLEKDHQQAVQVVRQIEQEDDRLFTLGSQALRMQWINLPAWRDIRGDEDTLGWWWRLDKVNLEDSARLNYHHYAVIGFWMLVSALFLYRAADDIGRTANQLTTFILRLVNRPDSPDLGLDLFTVGGIVAQVLFSGRLSISFAERFAYAINNFLNQVMPTSPRFLAQVTRMWLPVSRIFIVTFIFWGITIFIGQIIVPRIGNALQSQAESTIQTDDPNRTQSIIELAGLLNPGSNYTNDLALLGIRYEGLGNFEQAATIYETVLNSDPSFIAVRYRLAELYIENDKVNEAIALLDEGLQEIGLGDTTVLSERLGSPGRVAQLRFLLLVSRGRAFLEADLPGGAIVDLCAAEDLVPLNRRVCQNFNSSTGEATSDVNKDLFITILNKSNPPQNALPIVELYYYLARSYQARFEATPSGDEQAASYKDLSIAAWRQLQVLARNYIGRERIWLLEADTAIQTLESS